MQKVSQFLFKNRNIIFLKVLHVSQLTFFPHYFLTFEVFFRKKFDMQQHFMDNKAFSILIAECNQFENITWKTF